MKFIREHSLINTWKREGKENRLQQRETMGCSTVSKSLHPPPQTAPEIWNGPLAVCQIEGQRLDLTPLMLTGHWLWAPASSGFLFSSQGELAAEGCLCCTPRNWGSKSSSPEGGSKWHITDSTKHIYRHCGYCQYIYLVKYY